MLRIPDRELSSSATQELAALRTSLNAISPFLERATAGKAQWKQRRASKKSSLGPGAEVAATLTSMCHGIERCMYCEDSVAHQIEHGAPKNHFPGRVFDWRNMLYACQPCNGPKSDRFAVFRASDTLEFTLVRGQEPPPGRALLIDPRSEDPRTFFTLDLETGRFLIPKTLGVKDARRAEYSLKILRLNTRAILPRARRCAYGNYRARLKEYADAKGSPGVDLDRLRDELLSINHPTVWVEMVAQADDIESLKAIFDRAPEARGWTPRAGGQV